MGTRYKINMMTGQLDVAALPVTGGNSTSDYTMYSALTTGVNTLVHGRAKRTVGAEIWSFDCTDMITLVNDIKAKYEAHRVDLTEHIAADNVNVITAADATDIDTCHTLANDIKTQYAAHNADAELDTGWAYHNGQNLTTHILSFDTISFTSADMVAKINEMRKKYLAHDNDAGSHIAQGSNNPLSLTLVELWAMSIYAPREDSTDLLNNIIIDSSVIDYIKMTLYF